MKALAIALVIIYSGLSLAVFIHALLQLSLMRSCLRRRPLSQGHPAPRPNSARPLPFVTVQLPIYNERYVVERLIDGVVGLRYPRDRVEFQVLDDSTDDTVELVAAKVCEYRARGVDIHHMRRPTRQGFKAGALRYGLAHAKGELVALFDADFMPEPDFLLQTVPSFDDPRVGMVQTRWGHANASQSLLTRIQALMLDVHFAVEQVGRSEQGCFITFTGSAGVWRAAAIRDAADWDDETLTEDFDLSFRAQLRGWRFVYLDAILTTAELPEDVRSFRTQQFRWMKGTAQNAARLIPQILRADLTPRVKLHACANLLESSLHFTALGLPVLIVGLLLCFERGLVGRWVFFHPMLFLVVLGFVYFAPQRDRFAGIRGLAAYVGIWVSLFTGTLGLSVHNSIALLSGYLRWPGGFERTPKLSLATRRNEYVLRGFDRTVIVEAVVWLWYLAGLLHAMQRGWLYLLWMPAMAFIGLTHVLTLSVCHAIASARASRVGGTKARHGKTAPIVT